MIILRNVTKVYATGKEAHVLKHHGWLECVRFSPHGKALAVACGWGNEVRAVRPCITAKWSHRRRVPRWKPDGAMQLDTRLGFPRRDAAI